MKKYYSVNDCFEACNDDDVPFIDIGTVSFNYVIQRTKKELLESPRAFQPYLELMLSDQWQIKRAESKILTTNEIYRAACGDTKDISGFERYLIRLSDKNGQIREWLRPEQVELRNAILGNTEYEELERMVNNLRPPSF